jgi:hypothetical protein
LLMSSSHHLCAVVHFSKHVLFFSSLHKSHLPFLISKFPSEPQQTTSAIHCAAQHVLLFSLRYQNLCTQTGKYLQTHRQTNRCRYMYMKSCAYCHKQVTHRDESTARCTVKQLHNCYVTLLTCKPGSHTIQNQTSSLVSNLHHCTSFSGPLECLTSGDREYQPKNIK